MSKGVPGNRYVLEFGKLVVGNCETVRPFEINAGKCVRVNITTYLNSFLRILPICSSSRPADFRIIMYVKQRPMRNE